MELIVILLGLCVIVASYKIGYSNGSSDEIASQIEEDLLEYEKRNSIIMQENEIEEERMKRWNKYL